MPATLESLGIDKMTRDEQLSLAESIYRHVADTAPGSTLTDAQRVDLAERLRDDDENPDDTVPWDQVLAESLRKRS